MGALKLECFSNEYAKTLTRKSVLQDFDSARKQAFEDGVKSGANAASEAFETQKIRTLAPILEGLNDLAFRQEEARQSMLNSIRPLIEAMIATVLPQSAKAGLAHEISALVKNAAEKACCNQIIITVAQSAQVAVTQALNETTADYKIIGDPDRDELSAEIAWESGFDQVDISGAIEQIQTAISHFYPPLK